MPEWQIEKNQWGGERRFYIDERGIKNYEMLIDGIPESEFEARKQREREEAAERIRQQQQKHEKLLLCPFRMLRQDASLRCVPECALHSADGCGMVSDAELTGGAICPMKPGFKCSAACALYADGCKLKLLFNEKR